MDDNNVQTDELVEDDEAIELACKYPNKFSESVANEVSQQQSLYLDLIAALEGVMGIAVIF